MERDVLLTQEGYEKLQEELQQLSTDKRREVADRIRVAREFGDISENSEFSLISPNSRATRIRSATSRRLSVDSDASSSCNFS